jgi:hypothetical protein
MTQGNEIDRPKERPRSGRLEREMRVYGHDIMRGMELLLEAYNNMDAGPPA